MTTILWFILAMLLQALGFIVALRLVRSNDEPRFSQAPTLRYSPIPREFKTGEWTRVP